MRLSNASLLFYHIIKCTCAQPASQGKQGTWHDLLHMLILWEYLQSVLTSFDMHAGTCRCFTFRAICARPKNMRGVSIRRCCMFRDGARLPQTHSSIYAS